MLRNIFMVLTSIALAIFGYAIAAGAVGDIKIGYSTAQWNKSSAVISESYVKQNINKRSSGSVRSLWCPIVSFSYNVNGQSFTASGIMHKTSCELTQTTAKRIIEKYPVGSQHIILFNPSAPSNAVINAGVSFQNWFTLFTGICSIIGAVVIFWFNILINRLKAQNAAT